MSHNCQLHNFNRLILHHSIQQQNQNQEALQINNSSLSTDQSLAQLSTKQNTLVQTLKKQLESELITHATTSAKTTTATAASISNIAASSNNGVSSKTDSSSDKFDQEIHSLNSLPASIIPSQFNVSKTINQFFTTKSSSN
jgi:aminopeptidase N